MLSDASVGCAVVLVSALLLYGLNWWRAWREHKTFPTGDAWWAISLLGICGIGVGSILALDAPSSAFYERGAVMQQAFEIASCALKVFYVASAVFWVSAWAWWRWKRKGKWTPRQDGA